MIPPRLVTNVIQVPTDTLHDVVLVTTKPMHKIVNSKAQCQADVISGLAGPISAFSKSARPGHQRLDIAVSYVECFSIKPLWTTDLGLHLSRGVYCFEW